MENFSYHVPVYVVTGGIKTSGHSSELNPGGVSIYDRSTFSVATSAGNGKEFFFAQGSIGGKDWYGHPVTESHKSPFFMGKDVTNMYLSKPQTIQNEEWVIGFNGAASSKGLTFETGKATRVKLYFHGQPIYRFFGGPKEYVISYTPLEDCTTPCSGSDCPDEISDSLVHTQAIVDKINTHIELQKFGVRAQIVTTPYTAASTNMTKWNLAVTDNGDAQALQAVQAQVGSGIVVVRTSRVGIVSNYGFCQLTSAGTPTSFQQSADVLSAICSTCPVGSVLSSGVDVYYISRPLSGATDLSTTNLQNTFAGTVSLAYFPANTFNGATAVEVTPSSDAVTLTAHKFVTGQKVTYVNGGGTSITGLTTATIYHVIKVDANNIKLATTYANAIAGTAIAIAAGVGAAHSFTPVIPTTFVSQNGSVAIVRVSAPAGSVVTTLLSDTVDFSHNVGEACTFATPSAITWVGVGTGVSSTRTMKIKALQRLDCSSGDRLGDLTAILSGVVGINIGSLTKIAGTGCADDYTVTQNSLDCLDEQYCLSNSVTFTYDTLPAFENHSWELVPVVVAPNSNRKTGIRISAGYIDPKFGNCSFSPMDYYETMPLKMEVSLLQEDGSRCDAANWPSVQQTKIGRIARQSGEYVVREVIMKTNAYLKHMQQYSDDSRMREAFDQNLLSSVDRNAFYNIYYVSFKASYGNSYRKNEQEKFTAMFCFKEGDSATALFETNVLDVLTAKSGVKLHVED